MIYYLKYDVHSICKRLIEEQLKNAELKYCLLNVNELDFNQSLSFNDINALNTKLSKLGIEIVASQKNILVQKIKDAIIEMVNQEENSILSKTSYYLSKKLNQSYRYLSAVFTEVTYTTIENFIILQKIEKAKEMIAIGELTLTEIAWKLNYSSIGHFSLQFKNVTGFAPSLFKKVITQKRSSLIMDAIQ